MDAVEARRLRRQLSNSHQDRLFHREGERDGAEAGVGGEHRASAESFSRMKNQVANIPQGGVGVWNRQRQKLRLEVGPSLIHISEPTRPY